MRKKERLILVISIFSLMMGAFIINFNSSQMVKDNSCIKVCTEEKPKLIFTMKNKQIVFDTNFVYNLKNGIEVIYDNIITYSKK